MAHQVRSAFQSVFKASPTKLGLQQVYDVSAGAGSQDATAAAVTAAAEELHYQQLAQHQSTMQHSPQGTFRVAVSSTSDECHLQT
jgi:RNA-splicing ligase RtcB